MALDAVSRQRTCFQNNSEKIIEFLKGDDVVQKEHLYQHQVDALKNIQTQFGSNCFGRGGSAEAGGSDCSGLPRVALVVLPTGCRRTGIAVLAPYVLASCKVLVVTPSVDISEKILKEFSGENFFLKTRKFYEEEDRNNVCPTTSCSIATSKPPDEQAYEKELLIVNAQADQIKEIKSDKFDLVIVDEAHHYPASTWKTVVDHFRHPTFCLFLTATTPEYEGKPILRELKPCFELKREDAVSRGIIRNMEFKEVPSGDDNRDGVYKAIVAKVEQCLNYHDAQDKETLHQAMVLAQTKDAADKFQKLYESESSSREICSVYTTDTGDAPLFNFNEGRIRTLVVVSKLCEDYDNKRVSVVAIIHNIAPSSHVLFAQLVSRAVRKLKKKDPVTAVVVSHPKFEQRPNYDHFDQVAEVENKEEEDKEDENKEDETHSRIEVGVHTDIINIGPSQ